MIDELECFSLITQRTDFLYDEMTAMTLSVLTIVTISSILIIVKLKMIQKKLNDYI